MKKYSGLGRGELESLCIALYRDAPVLSNDRNAKSVAHREGVKCWSLPEILRALFIGKLMSSEEIKEIIGEIESKDNIVFKNPERITRI